MLTIKVFDGYVRLVSKLGSDYDLARMVRVSYGKDEHALSIEDAKRIINNLIRNKHLSPFEFLCMVFKIKAPIFVARQWMRHRTGSYLEKSLRYTKAHAEFYIPDNLTEAGKKHLEIFYSRAFELYKELLESEKKEQARAVLPIGLYTEFYFKMDLRNLMHFLELRLDKHAQFEIRKYAEAIGEIFRREFPIIYHAWKEHRPVSS